jgi:hypothetical protein
MGQKAAEFALSNEKSEFLVPTELIIRDSL